MQLACKPVSVRFCLLQKKLKPFPSFILIPYRYAIHTTHPPASDEQPLSPVYMIFQPIRRTAPDVAIRTGKLLPHLFTLSLRPAQGGYFLLHYYTLADIFPLGSMVLCVDRTFLPLPTGRRRWNNLLHCKGSNLSLNVCTLLLIAIFAGGKL